MSKCNKYIRGDMSYIQSYMVYIRFHMLKFNMYIRGNMSYIRGYMVYIRFYRSKSSDRGSGRRPIFQLKAALPACAYKRRGMADFRHHFLGGYRYCSSTKPRLRIDLGTKKGLPFTACRNSIWFDFYDCSKNA